ncbi:MAG TPA: hypothetical protein VGX25_05380 [Actinophytocola sp.]|uniref:hypothetical protein n=1 Tax=Actinophytocola sp. TaxID=1872138 RepID=UPI002DDDA9A2|nr:hypothetical protein [Actinophytocola sp.]HEV2778814.1 hypothetical protein [Actinophytocola sp.]
MAYDRHADLTVYSLTFDEYPGLTVRVRKPGVAGVVACADWISVQSDRSAGRVARWLAQLRLFVAFADALAGWDLLNSGRPVPATREGVLAQDEAFLRVLAGAWYANVVLAAPSRPAAEQEPTEPQRSEVDGQLDDGLAVVVNLPDEAPAGDAEPELVDQAG